MLIYGTAILAISHLFGDFLGKALGRAIGVEANVGAVAIAMILLIFFKEFLAKRGLLPQTTQLGVLYWSGMYIPIVVAMSAGQNVVGALSGGMVGVVVSIVAVVATVLTIRWLNQSSGDYDSYQWPNETNVEINEKLNTKI